MRLIRFLRAAAAWDRATPSLKSLPKWTNVGLYALSLVFADIFFWLIYQTALDKDVEFWGKVFILAGFVVSAGAAILLGYRSDEARLKQRLSEPRTAILVLAAIFVGSGTMADMVGLFEPRPATTRDTVEIKNQVDELASILERQFPADPPILEGISGRWGEQDSCALVWDISIVQRGNDAALKADLVVRPIDVGEFTLLAEIIDAEGFELTVIGEEPAQARGRAAAFELNAASQRLVWDDKSSAGGVEEYVRCPAG